MCSVTNPEKSGRVPSSHFRVEKCSLLDFDASHFRETTMTMIKSLLSTLLLLVTFTPCTGSGAFSRGIAVNAGTSLFGIPRGGGLFGGNKQDKYVIRVVVHVSSQSYM